MTLTLTLTLTPEPDHNPDPNPDTPVSTRSLTLTPAPTPNQVALVVAYAGGAMDEWTKSRLTLVYATGGAVLLAILLLTVC